MNVKVGLIGDYSLAVTAHAAIPKALTLAAGETNCEVEETWLATETIIENLPQLADFDALWCVPASPYRSMNGALTAIRFARERKVPFLGTCGGFQHAVIETARNVLGFAEADHSESNPTAKLPLMTALSCSLVEKFGTIKLKENSRIRQIYGTGEIAEQYHCNFGFNTDYLHLFETGEMKITGSDAETGEPRVAELSNHPFFVATLFQPERSALAGKTHPLVSAYLKSAKTFRNQGRAAKTTHKKIAAEV